MSKEERHRIYEYAMDRKNREIAELEERMQDMQSQNEHDKKMLIVAEVFLFLLGVLVGGLLMKQMGGMP